MTELLLIKVFFGILGNIDVRIFNNIDIVMSGVRANFSFSLFRYSSCPDRRQEGLAHRKNGLSRNGKGKLVGI